MKVKIDDDKVWKELGPLAGTQAMLADPRTEQGLEPLLEFDRMEKLLQPKQCAQISAVLVAAASADMAPDWDNLKVLRDYLLQAPPERTSQLLQTLQDHPREINAAVGEFMVEAQLGVPFTGIDIHPSDAELLEVRPQTLQSLQCAQAVNTALKSIISDGAPNQAPDVFRTSGRNVLLYEKRKELLEKALTHDRLNEKYDARYTQLLQVDALRLEKGGAGDEESLYYGEQASVILTDGYKTATTGTGKCAEHASASLALLTDPQSLAKMGVDLPDGSLVMLAVGNNIDHAYVLIAAPGAVTISDDRDRRVQVHDPRNVVVVDPWMPVPCAHTLDRSTDDIQQNPLCKLAVAKNGDVMTVLDRNGEVSVLPPPPHAVLDVYQNLHKNYREEVLDHAQRQGYISRDKQANLLLGCAQVVQNSIIAQNTKPPFYSGSHMSTHTPHDTYQSGGVTCGFFAAPDPKQHAKTLQSIGTSNQEDLVDLLLDENQVQVLQQDRVAQQNFPTLGPFITDPRNAYLVEERRTPRPVRSQIPLVEQQQPAPPKPKKSLRDDPAMRSTMENVERRSHTMRQPLGNQSTSTSSITTPRK